MAGDAPEALLDGYDATCRPAAQANADESFENLTRLGEIALVIGAPPDLAALERRIASLTEVERQQLAAAIEAQRSHFLSDGRLPVSPAGDPRPVLDDRDRLGAVSALSFLVDDEQAKPAENTSLGSSIVPEHR